MVEYIFALNDDHGLEERRERVVRYRDCGYSITYSSGQMCCLRTSRFVDQHDFCSKAVEKWES